MKYVDKRAFKILEDLNISNSVAKELDRGRITQEDFEYAKEKGVMFDDIYLIHEQAYAMREEILKAISLEDVSEAFLYSLSTRHLAYRSALASYVYLLNIPKHDWREVENYRVTITQKDGTQIKGKSLGWCGICHWNLGRDEVVETAELFGRNFANYHRLKYGMSCQSVNFALADLNLFLQLDKKYCCEEDVKILSKILECVNELKPNNKAGVLQKLISQKKFFPSNKSEVSTILDTLGMCGILETHEQRGFLYEYSNALQTSPPELTNDYYYPVNWWKAKNGINRNALQTVFGKWLGSASMKSK